MAAGLSMPKRSASWSSIRSLCPTGRLTRTASFTVSDGASVVKIRRGTVVLWRASHPVAGRPLPANRLRLRGRPRTEHTGYPSSRISSSVTTSPLTSSWARQRSSMATACRTCRTCAEHARSATATVTPDRSLACHHGLAGLQPTWRVAPRPPLRGPRGLCIDGSAGQSAKQPELES
jgi:hypothetical protein